MFQEIYPILSTGRMPEMLRFYRDLLGAAQIYRFPEEGPPAYVGLRLGTASELGLAASGPVPAGPRHVDLCVYAVSCDEAVAHLRGHGVTITEEPSDQPWGERMARALDPDGNPLVILSRQGADHPRIAQGGAPATTGARGSVRNGTTPEAGD